jgi:lipopolysaccharide export system protein LptA
MMRRWIAIAAVLAGPALGARGEAEDLPAAEDLTVITSERLTFDYKAHYALFEENVVVVDPEMKIFADRMTVKFDDHNKAQTITAEGRVNIIQEDKKARSETATYEVATGKIVLRGSPRVTQGKDILTAETITFWRDENKMLCEPKARLIIYPKEGESGGALDGIMGVPRGGK